MKKLIIAVLVIAIGVAVWFTRTPRAPTAESIIRHAKQMEFIGESVYPDGGSVGFNFLTEPQGQFQVIVRHRQSGKGGNPAFQEVYIGVGTQLTVIAPKSVAENDLLRLLPTAGINTNFSDVVGMPKRERLQWLEQRIFRRDSAW
jgi:hypothetical protein